MKLARPQFFIWRRALPPQLSFIKCELVHIRTDRVAASSFRGVARGTTDKAVGAYIDS